MATDFAQAIKDEEEKKKKNNVISLPNLPSPEIVPDRNKFSVLNTPVSTDRNRNSLTQADHGKTTNMTPDELSKLNTTLKVPVINETSNDKRDSELGKITSSISGNTSTYNIGGNSLSYKLNDNDSQIKTNLEKINQIATSGAEISPEQTKQINTLRQQAGFLRGGTDKKPVDINGLPVSSGNNITSSNGLSINFPKGTDQNIIDNAKKLNTQINQEYVDPTAIANRSEQSKQFLARQGYKETPEYLRNILKPGDIPGMSNRALREYNNRILDNNLSKDKNRVEEISSLSQNKLRDIQGDVLKNPPLKENALKPIVVEESDPTDPTGMRKKQVIKMPNAEGTGYLDQTNQTFTTPKPATTEKLLKMRSSKDPNFAAAEAEYKTRFGNLPY